MPAHVDTTYVETFEILKGHARYRLETTMPATYLAGPPIALQRALFGVLGWMGRMAGYKTAYTPSSPSPYDPLW